MTASNYSSKATEDKTSVSLIGNPCGHHGQCTFYKAFRYQRATDDLQSSQQSGTTTTTTTSTKTKTTSNVDVGNSTSSSSASRILMLGEFFFLRISPHDDPCIGELQLLWEDRQRNQLLSSTRLYFLPEQTPDGRQSHHGEHEMLAASKKVVLRLTDLVSWITHKVYWIAGLHYHWCPPSIASHLSQTDRSISPERPLCLSSRAFHHNQNVHSQSRSSFLTSQRIISDRCPIVTNSSAAVASATSSHSSSSSSSSNDPHSSTELVLINGNQINKPRGLDFNDVIDEKLKLNEEQTETSTVVILSYSRYCRYRTLLRRLDGPKRDLLIHKKFVQDALLELGIPMQRNNRVNILFCRDSFDHEALALNELNCDHLAPKLKGRPRKRPTRSHKSFARGSSPESISSDENARASSLSTITTQPRRSRRSAVAATTTSSGMGISYFGTQQPKSNRRTKPKRSSKSSPTLKSRTNSQLNSKSKSNKSENGVSANGNETDSNSSVDANNNLTDQEMSSSSSSNVNQERKKRIVTEEPLFLKELNRFMNSRKTPIQRVPNLGFKKIDLHVFYTRAQEFGGYDVLTKQRLWKKLYDKMGGDKRSTSAATCTRRHYEKLLLPFERFLKGRRQLQTKSKASSSSPDECKSSKDEDESVDDENGSTTNCTSTDDECKEKISTISSSETNVDKQVPDDNDNTGRVINVDSEQERLILKFSRTTPTLNSKRKVTNFLINNVLNDEKKVNVDVDAAANDDDGIQLKTPNKSFKDEEENVEISLAIIENDTKLKEKVVKVEEKEDDDSMSSITIRSTSNKSERFCGTSMVNSHSKVTALVYPTQRETKPADDVYDFKDNGSDSISDDGQSEILLLRSSNIDEQSKLSNSDGSPLDSINTLVRQMPLQTKKRSPMISKDIVSPVEKSIRNSFPRSLIDSPNDIMLTLKSNETIVKNGEPKIVPQPAHLNHVHHSTSRIDSKPKVESKIDILDLSIKKRFHENDSTTSNSSILDLSIKKQKKESNESKRKDSISQSQPLPLWRPISTDSNPTKHIKTWKSSSTNNGNDNRKMSESNDKSTIVDSIRFKCESPSVKRRTPSATSNNTVNKPSSSMPLILDIPKPTTTSTIGSKPNPSQQQSNNSTPSISDYNPSLPSFHSPPLLPNWPISSGTGFHSTAISPQVNNLCPKYTDVSMFGITLTFPAEREIDYCRAFARIDAMELAAADYTLPLFRKALIEEQQVMLQEQQLMLQEQQKRLQRQQAMLQRQQMNRLQNCINQQFFTSSK